MKKTSKRGYAYYGCENNTNKDEARKCDFMTWDVPVKDNCPECGHTLFKKSGRGFRKPFCINPDCSLFVPEEERGYKKKTATAAAESPAEGAPPEEEPKKAAAKKTTAKKTTAKRPPPRRRRRRRSRRKRQRPKRPRKRRPRRKRRKGGPGRRRAGR